MPTGIFISYRRDDSSGSAGRLYDRLVAQYGPDRVFMDIDTIRPGHDFAEDIERALSESLACIVLIGRQWESITDADGRRRLEDPTDFVRLEVAAAIRRGVIVIPVLVEGASPPSATSLPVELQPLARRQAIELSNERWHYDVSRLVLALDEVVEAPAEEPPEDVVPTEAPKEEPPPPVAEHEDRPEEKGPPPADPPDGGPPSEPPGGGEERKGIGRVPVIAAVVVAILVVIGVGAWAMSRGSDPRDTADPTGGPDTTASQPSVTDPSSTEPCTTAAPPLSPSSGGRLSGAYDVRVVLTCQLNELQGGKLWGEGDPEPGVSGDDWDSQIWTFTPTGAGALWTFDDRLIEGAELDRQGNGTYKGTDEGPPPVCTSVPEPANIDRDLFLSVSGEPDATALEGWLVISWTCDDLFVARFAVSGTRTP